MGRYIGELSSDVYGINCDEGKIAKLSWSATEAAKASKTAVLAATAGATDAQTVAKNITNPPCARTLTVTVGGETSAHIKGGTLVIHGTNIANEAISEDFTITEGTPGDVTGTKAFKTVTSIVIPKCDGTGCTFSVGTGEKLGVPFMLSEKPIFVATFDGADDAGEFTVDDNEVEKNVFDCYNALNGKFVNVAIIL